MAANQKIIYVYDDFNLKESVLIGKLYVNTFKDKETYAFEYDKGWLRQYGISMQLDPELLPYAGRQYPLGNNIYGMFADIVPDSWGRSLLDKREALLADKEGRRPLKLYDSDYLLGVSDEARIGGLRFKTTSDGDFLANTLETAVPPWESLRSLEEAAGRLELEAAVAEDCLSQLIRAGAALGGARPKATVRDKEGNLWIAKFPSQNDRDDAGAWEMEAHDLALLCGLEVPEAKLEKFSALGSTLLVKRFDRKGKRRIHFASAATLLGKNAGNSGLAEASYLDIANFIKAYGAAPKKDLLELWKRIVFNMAITNTDDNLRNHAFIITKNGWTLAPLYNVKPMPYGNKLSLRVDENDNTISLELAIRTAFRFGITEAVADVYAKEIVEIVKGNWQALASKYKLSAEQQEKMRSAFSIC